MRSNTQSGFAQEELFHSGIRGSLDLIVPERGLSWERVVRGRSKDECEREGLPGGHWGQLH